MSAIDPDRPRASLQAPVMLARTGPVVNGPCSVRGDRARLTPCHDLPSLAEATSSDALAAVRRHLWAHFANQNSPAPPGAPPMANPPAHLLSFLVDAACYAA